jgi:hypothetical protein
MGYKYDRGSRDVKMGHGAVTAKMRPPGISDTICSMSNRYRRSGETITAVAWAQAAPGCADLLRRGAWYPIVKEEDEGHVVLDVDQQPVRVSREDLRIRLDRPETWSVVVRTGVMRPTLSGVKLVTTYAVCPDCHARQEFEGHPDTLICARCRRAAKVDWSTTL